MAWCPKCKTESRLGDTTCEDCGTELVENLATIQTEELEEIDDDSLEEIAEEIPLSQLIPESSLTYVKKEDKYNDLKSTAYIFTIFGILGLVFVGLNMAEVLTLLTSPLQFIVLGGVSIGFIIIGIRSWFQSRSVYQLIDTEKEVTTKIKEWLEVNITEETLAQFESDEPSELIFLKKVEYIKTRLLEVFDVDSETYLDSIVEEFYSEHFE